LKNNVPVIWQQQQFVDKIKPLGRKRLPLAALPDDGMENLYI